MKILRPWLFVVLGILLTMASAVLSNHTITKNLNKIEELQEKSERLQNNINSMWANAQALEHKKDVGMLMMTIPLSEGYAEQLSKYAEDSLRGAGVKLQGAFPSSGSMAFSMLVEKAREYQNTLNDRINDAYAQKLEIEGQVADIKQKNSQLTIAALFLQLLALILILSKDILSTNASGKTEEAEAEEEAKA